MGTLFLVATPIGNLADMSPRAVSTLRAAALIAAEDTRRTGKLMGHFGIQGRIVSYHDHNEEKMVANLLEALAYGDVALVSDAGTPGINDPGYPLVRAAIAAGHLVSPVPGPSAPIAALAASGLPADTFLYLGYLPRKKAERRTTIAANAAQPHTLVFLETPHRLQDALADLEDLLGNRRIAVARELTKLHEEFVRGTVSEVRDHFEANPPRGELTLVVGGAEKGGERWTEAELESEIRAGLAAGEPASALARSLAGASGWNRREIYDKILKN
ncbi:MAG TPA: 16S rRNA (cytidine(1402)-2'-O)-methyltransferase [Anaerolineales bacterium]|nr:16S rRNA (cytidine(1402)-2'-O)-methyltransferase [Anaerolineales bacterium]